MSLKTARSRRLRELATRLSLQLRWDFLLEYNAAHRVIADHLMNLRGLARRELRVGPWVLRLYHDPGNMLATFPHPIQDTLARVHLDQAEVNRRLFELARVAPPKEETHGA